MLLLLTTSSFSKSIRTTIRQKGNNFPVSIMLIVIKYNNMHIWIGLRSSRINLAPLHVNQLTWVFDLNNLIRATFSFFIFLLKKKKKPDPYHKGFHLGGPLEESGSLTFLIDATQNAILVVHCKNRSANIDYSI